ncbi:hypothetical protein SPRG_19759 [Saprolegnia parasitica CBS 223.65]|uniref:Uncharacterized protein n=1 Tax=Saprolegnia parasitica (strain CBS 223.65) TaxID=695850 RepID=A0A067CLX5_SAPPC|nr:hypothetical protein SPRG_19759 [Saprolegnia parasitica CBS 223.65]KDO30195.1 hypothetical protein SPRG_19759 [Saprolegnia parasitica CBS 223.65]|eukprot:XP_012199015.1 hypothetical protein SPRG_19759 [Saprolegnia parasitica CBS 223.65]
MPQRPVAYTAKYECPDENYIATQERQHMDDVHDQHLREMRPMISKDLTHDFVRSDAPNKKRLALEHERQMEISLENNILIDKMQRIMVRKERLSHFPDVPKASMPKPSNAPMRERVQSQIKSENAAIKSHLAHVKGTYNVATWAKEAEQTNRLVQQISKVPRRAKTKQRRKRQPRADVDATQLDDFEFLVLTKTDTGLPMRTAKEIRTHIQSKLPSIHQKAAMYMPSSSPGRPNPFEIPRRPFE